MEDIQLIITMAGRGTDPLPALLQQQFAACACYREPGMQLYRAGRGVLLQFCGLGAKPPAYLLEAPQPVLAFKVPELAEAISIAEAQGALFLDQAKDQCTGFAFAYLQLPDGGVLGYFE